MAPFILLTLPASFLVWSRVYFYGVLATAFATAFFASPAKPFLAKKLKVRAGDAVPELKRSHSHDSLSKEPILGLPSEPAEDMDEIIAEVRAEMQRRKKAGVAPLPVKLPVKKGN